MNNNPYQSRPGRNPWLVLGWLVILACLSSAYFNDAWAGTGQNPTEEPSLLSEAWMIHHGIETSQWKDAACKARALRLVDETKLTWARLDEALHLALNAATIECGRGQGRSRGAARPARRP